MAQQTYQYFVVYELVSSLALKTFNRQNDRSRFFKRTNNNLVRHKWNLQVKHPVQWNERAVVEGVVEEVAAKVTVNIHRKYINAV